MYIYHSLACCTFAVRSFGACVHGQWLFSLSLARSTLGIFVQRDDQFAAATKHNAFSSVYAFTGAAASLYHKTTTTMMTVTTMTTLTVARANKMRNDRQVKKTINILSHVTYVKVSCFSHFMLPLWLLLLLVVHFFLSFVSTCFAFYCWPCRLAFFYLNFYFEN